MTPTYRIASAILSLPAIALAQGGPDQLSIVLTPVLDRAARPVALNVHLDIPASRSASPLVLELNTLAPGLQRDRDQVSRLAVRDQTGAVSMTSSIGGADSNGTTFQRWRSTRPTAGAVTVSYEMPAALSKPAKRGPHEDLQVAGGGLSGAFAGFLVLPAGSPTLDVNIGWRLPAGQSAVSTRGAGDVHWTGTPQALRDTLFLAGPVARWPQTASPNSFTTSTLGVPADKLPAAASWPMRAYEAERTALGQPRTAYRFLIRSYDGGPVSSGRADQGGYLLYLPLGDDPAAAALRATMAHEMVHSLVGYLDGEPGEEGDWFTEGIADYLGLILPQEAGLYSKDEYLRLVNQEAASYYTNTNRALPNREAAERMFTGRNTWSTLYRRGALYFADLDAKLKARQAGSVVDLIRIMIARIRGGAPATAATWQAVLRERTGPWAVTDWQEMMQGALVRPAPGAFGRCLIAERIKTGWFDLGFTGSTHLVPGTVITGLNPTSNAARAGLRDGDVLAVAIDLNQYTDRLARPMTLQVKRNSIAQRVTFDPHEGQLEAIRWHFDRGCSS